MVTTTARQREQNRTANKTQQPQQKKDPPAAEVRLGRIKGCIWENQTQSGVQYNVTFSRIYKKDGDANWHDSTSFGRDDLLVLGKVADEAHTWICEQQQTQEP